MLESCWNILLYDVQHFGTSLNAISVRKLSSLSKEICQKIPKPNSSDSQTNERN